MSSMASVAVRSGPVAVRSVLTSRGTPPASIAPSQLALCARKHKPHYAFVIRTHVCMRACMCVDSVWKPHVAATAQARIFTTIIEIQFSRVAARSEGG
jgi:hypothetical protein